MKNQKGFQKDWMNQSKWKTIQKISDECFQDENVKVQMNWIEMIDFSVGFSKRFLKEISQREF